MFVEASGWLCLGSARSIVIMNEDEALALAISLSLQESYGDSEWILPSEIDKERSDRDTRQYREKYPGLVDTPGLSNNLLFYQNVIPCSPNGDFIGNIHKLWWGNYDLLEKHHGYVQWLFPIREKGGNKHAHPLQIFEAEAMSVDVSIPGEDDTGLLERNENYQMRFDEVNEKFNHNFLRITRILKCLGEVGMESPYKLNFILYIIEEIGTHGNLHCLFDPLKKYWVGTLRIDKERYEAGIVIEKMEHASHETEENEKYLDDDEKQYLK